MVPDMVQVLKRPGSKYWQFWLKRNWKSTKCTDKKEAQIVAEKVLEQLRNRKLLAFDPSIIPLERAIEDYLLKRVKMESKTQLGDKYALKLLYEYYSEHLEMHKITLSRITKHNIEGWITWMQNEKGFESGGINTHIRRTKAFFKSLLKWDYITDDPSRFLKQSKVIKKLVRLITREERENICNESKLFPQLKYAIPMMFYAGIARQEITMNFNISEKAVFYIRKKTNKPVTVSISELLKPYLSDLPLGINRIFKFQPRHFSRLFEKFMEHCKNKKIINYNITPHAIRHNFTIWYLESSGGDFEGCAEILGHGDHGVTILKNYSQYIPQKTKAILDRL